jgi:hypothetical protein
MSPATQLDIIPKIEAILADAKKLKQDDMPAKLGLMRQVDDLYHDLEPPINSVSPLMTTLPLYDIDWADMMDSFSSNGYR